MYCNEMGSSSPHLHLESISLVAFKHPSFKRTRVRKSQPLKRQRGMIEDDIGRIMSMGCNNEYIHAPSASSLEELAILYTWLVFSSLADILLTVLD